MSSLKYTNVKVYNPDSDSYFLADVLTNTLDNKDKMGIEVGIGSGYISIQVALKFPKMSIIGTDISFSALQLAHRNIHHHLRNHDLSLVQMDLLQGLNPPPNATIWFNPPYVRSTIEELNSNDPMIRSYAGGPTGAEVIKKFVEFLKGIYFKRCFILTSNRNDNSVFKKNSGYFSSRIIAEKQIPGEKLLCYVIYPSTSL